MLIFASSVEVTNESHWAMWVALIATSVLFLIVCTIVLLLCFSDRQKLTNGRMYVRRAPEILKWSAFAAPILMLIGCAFSFYSSLIRIGIRGEITIHLLAGPINELMISIIIGFGVSLLCLLGIAIHFFRTRNS